ncbi:hypothetical protein [Dictyobacter kobayashii]|uniref:Uncharacterized protein n=1 Tax=Dictyobacter kobayashii TaxID=2014872 RepID=A0A402ADI3_9CHLR|nr:hypothetical protein [Dictyobacter kobayashii]GCE17151.1 hypothetical protein KDK_09510 [Dictyobacter kobayashii]
MPRDDWRHTSNDPFAEQWEQILAWIQANPSRSSGDIFCECQRRRKCEPILARFDSMTQGV